MNYKQLPCVTDSDFWVWYDSERTNSNVFKCGFYHYHYSHQRLCIYSQYWQGGITTLTNNALKVHMVVLLLCWTWTFPLRPEFTAVEPLCLLCEISSEGYILSLWWQTNTGSLTGCKSGTTSASGATEPEKEFHVTLGRAVPTRWNLKLAVCCCPCSCSSLCLHRFKHKELRMCGRTRSAPVKWVQQLLYRTVC